MIIFRYITKEIFTALVALTMVLLLIFMSNQCIQYLNAAANGRIPGIFILKLMLLEMPNLVSLLLPLGFYIAILLSYGRLYAESEMTAMFVGGYSPQRLLRDTMLLATLIAIFVGILIFWVSPWIAFERLRILKSTGVKILVQTLAPMQFKSAQNGQVVFYIEGMSRHNETAKNVFIARRQQDQKWQIIWANEAQGQSNPKTKEDELVLKHGQAYIGSPGQANYQVIQFTKANVRLPHTTSNPEQDIRTATSSSLWPYLNADTRKAAELQWRFSVPVMVLILAFLAVPLSRVKPRSGKYANLLLGILLYVLYANFMFVARNWVLVGKVPIWIGIWWLHILFFSLACFLWWRDTRNFA